MASEVLFTIWQGGQLAIPMRATLAKVKAIMGADYTLAMLFSIMYAPCCQTLICSNKAKSVVTGKHYMPSVVGSTSFSMKSETLHLIAGFNNIQHILTNQSVPSHTHCMEKRELSAQPQEGTGNYRNTEVGSSRPFPPLPAVEHLNG
jgi:hypothetical protein